MLFFESLEKQYCCPPKNTRQVGDGNGSHPYTRHKVKLCRAAVSGKRTDWVVTKELAQSFT